MSRARFSAEGWRGLFRRQRASGLSVAAFCAREEIPASSFFSWRRKLEGAAGFAEVKLAGEAENESSTSIRRGAAVGVKAAGGGMARTARRMRSARRLRVARGMRVARVTLVRRAQSA